MRNTISKTDAAWTAGIIDADGCIFIRKVYPEGIMCYSLAVTVSQSGKEKPKMLEKLSSLWGGGITGKVIDKRKDCNRQPAWRWQVVALQADRMLNAIKPLSVAKQNQVLIALEYRKKALGKDKKSLQERYYLKLRATKNYKRRTSN